MQPLSVYLAACVARRLLVPSPLRGVFWSASIPGKIEEARRRKVTSVQLDLGDFLVADYTTLANAKRGVQALAPGSWSGTEIHHIVENFHLQFLGVVQTINEQTYHHSEPCVLLPKKQHDTQVNAAVGDAETLFMEDRPFNFVAAFRDAHPGISASSLGQQAALRAAWVKAQEGRNPPTVRRREIRDTLLDIYRHAYQESDLQPLRLIAEAVIRGMPL